MTSLLQSSMFDVGCWTFGASAPHWMFGASAPHFIRPAFLLALIPAIAVLYFLHRGQDSMRSFRKMIAPNLLPHLIVRSGSAGRWRPVTLLGVILILGILAAAGPTWKREPAPFGEDTAALMIVLKASESMKAQDIQPSRLERAAQKIGELMKQREGSYTGLMVYSGTAHLVMPLTKDGGLISRFAGELSPEIMPEKGDVPSEAIAMAQEQLERSGRPGCILLVTDDVSTQEAVAIAKLRKQGAPKIHVYATAGGPDANVPMDSPPAAPLDETHVQAAASAGGGSLVFVTADNTDVIRLAGIVESQISQVAADEETQQWQDSGYWFVPIIALLGLLWFRPGWVVQHAALWLFLVSLLASTTASAQEKNGGTSENVSFLFKTRDQHAQSLFNDGKFAEAAPFFSEPMRQGMAWYRAGEFKKAAAAFGRVNTSDGFFNRGNALVMSGKYDDAIRSYQSALKMRPAWEAAKTNLEIAEARKQAMALPEDAVAREKLTKDDAPDEIVFDDRAKNNPNAAEDTVAGAGEEMKDDAMRALWLKRVETKPADFLRAKFAYQLAKREREVKENE